MKLITAVLLTFILFGCASSPNGSQTKPNVYKTYIEENELKKSTRITAFRFHGWSSLDRNFLIISTTYKKPYLIELRAPCYDLPFAHSISVENEGASLDAGFDSIKIPDSVGGECRINAIYPLTPEQADEVRALD